MTLRNAKPWPPHVSLTGQLSPIASLRTIAAVLVLMSLFVSTRSFFCFGAPILDFSDPQSAFVYGHAQQYAIRFNTVEKGSPPKLSR